MSRAQAHPETKNETHHSDAKSDAKHDTKHKAATVSKTTQEFHNQVEQLPGDREAHHEILDGLVKEVDAIKDHLADKPEMHGWLLFIAGSLLVTHVMFGGLRFFNDIIIALGLYLMGYGAYKIHLYIRFKRFMRWARKHTPDIAHKAHHLRSRHK